jgi:hypothetical protein
MATEVHYTIVDDLDHSTDRVGTYRFALEGVDYEIDLSEANLGRLRAALAPFIAAGRRLPKAAPKGRRATTGRTSGTSSAGIRDWWSRHWRELGLPEPRTRGAIPAAVRDAHRAAHPTT